MSGKQIELALRWLKKADHDLITARQTLLLADGPTDTVCFHAQQAIEKALKAILTFHRVAFPRIHDLGRLMDLAAKYLPGLIELADEFAQISVYSVEARYPDEWFEPSRNDAEHSLAVAERAVAIAKARVAN